MSHSVFSPSASSCDFPSVHWMEEGEERSAAWRAETGTPPPKRIVVVDDSLRADDAFRMACEGTALLWQGDFQNARQLLQALARRAERKPRKAARARNAALPASPAEAFHQHRMAQAQRAHLLSRLLIRVEADFRIPLRRAPDVQAAFAEVHGQADAPFLTPLRAVQGILGAHEWRRKGVLIPALEARIHPHFGVFSPVRGEYLELLAQAPLPATSLAFDIGTGTGVLAALLAKRGVARVIATDCSPRALACARENMERLDLGRRVEIQQADLFPSGCAPLIVCNPPWIPAKAVSAIEAAIYDPGSRMLHGFLAGVGAHLEPGGEAWLILSDIAEHLGLRSRAELLAAFSQAGLRVIDRLDTRPSHPRASDADDPLHAARAAEVTSLWRLGAAE